VRVLGGGCVPLGEEGLPFAPVTQALRGLADLDPAELATVAGPARQELGRLLPDLAWGGEAATGAVVAGAGQGRLFERLLGMIERLAARTPLLWVVEDLHWADRSTRDLLAYLATALRSGRVMVVGTFRSDELHRLHPLHGLLGQLGRNRRVVRLELARFSRAEVAEQLAGLLGADPPARLVDDVYARSQGNPFFAEELLLAGADPGVLPPSLREVLLARVVRLGDRTQQLLGVAAAAGPGATQPLLAAVADMDDQQLLDGLREAVDQQLLLPDAGGGDGYVFRHALLAEAVYSELLASERIRLHTALAGALEAGLEAGDAPASRAARLAYHWAAAGDQPRALTASLAAAAAAERVYAFAEAQLQLERVLGLWDRVPDAAERAGTDRVGLLARCGEAAYGAGDPARGRGVGPPGLGAGRRGTPAAAGRAAARAAGPLPTPGRRPRRAGRPAAGGAAGAARAVGGAGVGAGLAGLALGAGGPLRGGERPGRGGGRHRRAGRCCRRGGHRPHRAGQRPCPPRRARRRAGRAGGGPPPGHAGRRRDRRAAGDHSLLRHAAGGRPPWSTTPSSSPTPRRPRAGGRWRLTR
jgi:hypothetical protein